MTGAEQDLDAAVLAAPISGRVGQVDLRKGEQASTSSAIVLVGPGAAVVTVDLPLAQLSKVRVAQEARNRSLQVALLVPLLAAVLGLGNSFRMLKLPDVKPTTNLEGIDFG